MVGAVDHRDERFGEHRYAVVSPTVLKPIFGEPWVDAFNAGELEPVN